MVELYFCCSINLHDLMLCFKHRDNFALLAGSLYYCMVLVRILTVTYNSSNCTQQFLFCFVCEVFILLFPAVAACSLCMQYNCIFTKKHESYLRQWHWILFTCLITGARAGEGKAGAGEPTCRTESSEWGTWRWTAVHWGCKVETGSQHAGTARPVRARSSGEMTRLLICNC